MLAPLFAIHMLVLFHTLTAETLRTKQSLVFVLVVYTVLSNSPHKPAVLLFLSHFKLSLQCHHPAALFSAFPFQGLQAGITVALSSHHLHPV